MVPSTMKINAEAVSRLSKANVPVALLNENTRSYARREGDDMFEILKYDWLRAMKKVM